MKKFEYYFIKAEIEREKKLDPDGFYLYCRMLPKNYEQLKAEYLRNGGIYNEPLLVPYNFTPHIRNPR